VEDLTLKDPCAWAVKISGLLRVLATRQNLRRRTEVPHDQEANPRHPVTNGDR